MATGTGALVFAYLPLAAVVTIVTMLYISLTI